MCFICINQTSVCGYACPSLCSNVLINITPFFMHTVCVHKHPNAVSVDAHLLLHRAVFVYLCVVCVQNRSESALCFHKWTLDPLGTRWRPANPTHIVYPSLYTMTGMVDRVYSLFCAAWRPGRWHLRKTICLVYSEWLQVQESFSSRNISCLFPEAGSNLIFCFESVICNNIL